MSILALKPATDLLVLFCKNRLETVFIVIHYTGRPENDRQYCLVRETESRISMGPFHVSIWLCFILFSRIIEYDNINTTLQHNFPL